MTISPLPHPCGRTAYSAAVTDLNGFNEQRLPRFFILNNRSITLKVRRKASGSDL